MATKKPKQRLSAENRRRLRELGVDLFAFDRNVMDVKFFSFVKHYKTDRKVLVIDPTLSDEMFNLLVQKELSHLESDVQVATNLEELEQLFNAVTAPDRPKIAATLSGILIPEEKTQTGTLIIAHTLAWKSLIEGITQDWSLAYEIPPRKWEEIIAGAFDIAGFDEVTLTPGSGDFGRDVVAIKHGVGSIKIISSVKAYKPQLLVDYDDIRALLGVLSGERDASKGIIATTSDFPPNVAKDRFVAPFLPTRLELLNGEKLRDWLADLAKSTR